MTATSRRPVSFKAGLNDEMRGLYAWFAYNGVTEILPDSLAIDVHGGKLTYTAFRWVGGRRGWDAEQIDCSRWDGSNLDVTEQRTVPLQTPVTDRVRAICRTYQIDLTE